MKIALVGPELEENLGLRYLHSSLAAAGHQPVIFDFHQAGQIAELVERIRQYRPALVGLSMVLTSRGREYLALASELRLAAIEFLRDGEQCVCDIADHVGSERSNVSRHLAVLLSAGLVECRKDGLRMLYSLKCLCVAKFVGCINQMLRENFNQEQAVLARL